MSPSRHGRAYSPPTLGDVQESRAYLTGTERPCNALAAFEDMVPNGRAKPGVASIDRTGTVCTVAGTVALTLATVACAAMRTQGPKPRLGEEDLIVDCLLPQRMITDPNLGVVEMPRPLSRRPRSTASIRAGYYQADEPRCRSACGGGAERGDAEAQYHVGEVYERGLDAGPDFASARGWYGSRPSSSIARRRRNSPDLRNAASALPLDGRPPRPGTSTRQGVHCPWAVLEQTRPCSTRWTPATRPPHELER